MHTPPGSDDLRVVTVVARASRFVPGAEQLSVPTAYVSKRMHLLEEALAVKLLQRTTAGERVFPWARRIRDDMDQLLQEVAVARRLLRGTLRIASSFGLGRNIVAPMISLMVKTCPACSCASK